MAVYLNNRKKIEMKYVSQHGPVFHFTMDPEHWPDASAKAPFVRIREADLLKYSWNVEAFGNKAVKTQLACQEYTLRLHFKNALVDKSGNISYLGGDGSHQETLTENFGMDSYYPYELIPLRNNETMMNMITSLEEITSLDAVTRTPGRLYVKMPRTNGTPDEYYTSVIIKEMTIIPTGREFETDVELKIQQTEPYWMMPFTISRSWDAWSKDLRTVTLNVEPYRVYLGTDYIFETSNTKMDTSGYFQYTQNFNISFRYTDRDWVDAVFYIRLDDWEPPEECGLVLSSIDNTMYYYEDIEEKTGKDDIFNVVGFKNDIYNELPAGKMNQIRIQTHAKWFNLTMFKKVPWPNFGINERSGS